MMVADSGTVFHMVMPPVADRLRQAACAITAAAMATPNPHPNRGRRELVSWRLYRALTGVALLALVLAALAVQHPDAPSPPDQPVTVSGASVISAAQEQSTAEHTAAGGCCAAGSAGELAGATDMSEKLTNFDPKPELVQFASNLAWRSQPVPMINVIAYKPGSQAGIIAVDRPSRRGWGAAADRIGPAGGAGQGAQSAEAAPRGGFGVDGRRHHRWSGRRPVRPHMAEGRPDRVCDHDRFDRRDRRGRPFGWQPAR